MSEHSSYLEKSLENKIVKLQQEIINLKTKQQYGLNQLNYSYESNSITMDSYKVWPATSSHHGIAASFVFTSQLNIMPRVFFTFSGAAALTYLRYETQGSNMVRITIELSDTLIPMTDPQPFTAVFSVYSNTKGTFKLEKTYVHSS